MSPIARPKHIIKDVMTGEVTEVPFTEEEWDAWKAEAIRIAAEEANADA